MLYDRPKIRKPADPEYGNGVQLHISKELKDLLLLEKIIPQEPMETCIRRIISERKAFQSELKSLKGE